MQIKIPDGYHLEDQDDTHGGSVPTKRFPNGGYVVAANGEDGDYDAYDSKGRYLGLFGNRDTAERSAQDGRLSSLNAGSTVSDLSLMVLWDDAVDCGVDVLQAEDGTQLLVMGDGETVLSAHKQNGVTFEWLTLDEVAERYGSDDEAYQLTHADKPYRMI